jgi:hypothetical protein
MAFDTYAVKIFHLPKKASFYCAGFPHQWLLDGDFFGFIVGTAIKLSPSGKQAGQLA